MKRVLLITLMLLVATSAWAGKENYRYCEPCSGILDTIYPNDEYQVIDGSIVADGDASYMFCAVGGGTYTFTFCMMGGWADYDTALSIQGPDECGAYLACNDDWCSLQSEIIWTAPADGNYIVAVDAYSSNFGSFGLAYSGPACLTPVEESSWSTLRSLY